MRLVSSAFQAGEAIPTRFTCEGENISPELSWTEAPKETKSFALIVHDPDAPRANGFVHWLLYQIPGNVTHIPEIVSQQPSIKNLGVQGKNDGGKIGYMGPCPPSGTHRYFFYLYSLNGELDLQPGASHDEVIAAIRGKIIEQTELVGLYTKGAKQVA